MRNEKYIEGETAGTFLLGIVKSFYDLNALPECGVNLSKIDPDKWYPFSLLNETIEAINRAQPSESLLFQAGINFFRLWYEQGPGKDMIFSSLDWVHLNDLSSGYNSVVRGGSREEIGWCDIRYFDEEKGIAIYDNVTPMHGPFVVGLYYGGFLIFDDIEYVEIAETDPVPYPENPILSHSTITVHFRLKPKFAGMDIDNKIDTLKHGEMLSLSADEVESLVWRYKGLKISKKISEDYSNQINSALARSINTIREISITDGLTNVFNRRHFSESFPKIINRAKRHNDLFCFLILDIDFFKQYNDTYGHLKGDEALVRVATTIKNQLRRTDDQCFRLGGEEFGVIIDANREDQALAFAKTILHKIEGLKIEHKKNSASPYITVSIGLICRSIRYTDSDDQIYKEADELLYKAKKNGRNRVETANK